MSPLFVRKNHSCVDLMTTVFALVEGRADRGEAQTVVPLDIARDFDSVWHTALWRSVRHRHAARQFPLAYLRGPARTSLVFQHKDFESSAIAPLVALRRGCSASPVLCRWVPLDGGRRRTGSRGAVLLDSLLLGGRSMVVRGVGMADGGMQEITGSTRMWELGA